MTMRVTGRVALLLLVCGAGTAQAQDDQRVGLTMGYPTAVGVLWHITGRIAVRPEIDFSRTTVKLERTGTLVPVADDEETSRSIRPGVSALFYLGPLDDLRTYVSPRFVFVSSNTSSSDPETDSYLASGSFGAQYRLGRRFAVSGELGIEWTRSTTRFALSPITGTTTIRSTGISSRSGVGVILYF